MSNSKLTICIPTYNRKERLISQLNALCEQPGIEEVPIILSDNASGYSIENEVVPLFAGKLNLTVRRFKVNTSMVINIASGYLYADTEWVWMLGDDDKVAPNAVATVLNDINNVSDDISLIQYSLVNENTYPAHPDEIVYTFADFVKHYKGMVRKTPEKILPIAGACVFVSIAVIRPRLLEKYISQAFFYSYNHIAYFAPSLFALQDGIGIKFSSARIVQYLPPEAGKHWGIVNFMLGLCTWRDMPIKAKEEDKKWFVWFISSLFTAHKFLKLLMAMDGLSVAYKAYVYKKVVRDCYYMDSYLFKRKMIFKFYRKVAVATIKNGWRALTGKGA